MFDNVLTSLTGEPILIASEPKLRVTSFESGPGIPSIRSHKTGQKLMKICRSYIRGDFITSVNSAGAAA